MMNFVLAIIIFIIIGLVQGVPSDKALIGEVQPDSAAAEAGMEAGDEVIEVDGNPVSTWIDFTEAIQKKPNEEVDLIVQREEHTETLTMIPSEVENHEGDTIDRKSVVEEKSIRSE